MSTVKSAAASRTVSLPLGRAAGAAAAPPPCPRAVSPSTVPAARTGTVRRRSVAAVGLTADHPEVLVELHVHLVAVVQGHLDLVPALLVTALGAGDATPAGLGQGGLAGALQRRAGDRDVRPLGGVRAAGRRGDADTAGAHDGHDTGHDC